MGLDKLMQLEEYKEHCADYDGICTECGAIRWGDTEPDAEGYHCDSCGGDTVVGFELAFMCGNILFL